LRRWRGELVKDGLQALDPRREREPIALDRLAQQLDQDGVIIIGQKWPRHGGIMRRKRSEGESVPMTLGRALDAKVRLIVWCKGCGHRAEPDVAAQIARYGVDTAVIDWASRLRCSACGERAVDFVVSGAAR
jgi:hypothetical protein